MTIRTATTRSHPASGPAPLKSAISGGWVSRGTSSVVRRIWSAVGEGFGATATEHHPPQLREEAPLQLGEGLAVAAGAGAGQDQLRQSLDGRVGVHAIGEKSRQRFVIDP